MRIESRLPLLLLLAACTTLPALPGGSPAPVPGGPPPPLRADAVETRIHELVGEHRRAQGLAPLTWDPTLAELAAAHSAEMAAGRRPFGHDGFDARAATATARLGISRFSENVAMNNYSDARVAQTVVDGWIGSPGHRRNLEGAYTLTGVGVARSAAGDTYATQLYAAP